MAEKKLSEELRHCLEDDACGDCQYWETETKQICEGLLQKAYEAVKRYEEMFTCKIGDIVWDNDFGKPYSYTVTGFSIGKIDDEENDIDGLKVYYRNWNGSICCSCAVSEFGKTVFLTKEAAENALKEMEDRKNGEIDKL